jgi:hypothetical protein
MKEPTGTTTEVLSSSDDGTSAAEKVSRPPADWEHFAPRPPRPPGRVAAGTRPVGRLFGHEWTLAVLGALALSALLNIGALKDLRHTLPQDVWDPSLQAYLIAWGGHALVHDPVHLWHLNAFFPMPYGLAFSDSLLGYAPLAIIGTGLQAAVLRYNIIFMLAQALAFVGAYALVRQLGAGRIGGLVAGVAFAVAPWRLGQAGHLHVLSTGGIALSLAMLARGHGVRWRTVRPDGDDERPSPPVRPGWALAGWLVATWQLSLGFGVGLAFLYVLLGAVVVGVAWWALRRRSQPPWRLLVADGAGGVIFAGVAFLLAQPYLRVLDLYPNAVRNKDWVALYSPPWRGLFIAPETSWIWGGPYAGSRAQLSLPGEMALLPGYTLMALAVAGLLFSIWTVWVRLALLAGVVVSAVLALGTNGPAGGKAGYLILLDNLPGFEGLRTPGRLIVWTTLLLAILAAGGVSSLATRAVDAARRRGLPQPVGVGRAALLIPVVLVLLEGIGTTPHPTVPPAPAALSTVAAPYLVLPSDEVRDMQVMLWSTDRFADVVNGGSGFVPAELDRTRQQVQTFPDEASVTYLRQLGVRTVVVLPDRVAGTPWENAATTPIDGLGLDRQVTPDAIVFRLTSG